MGYAINGVFTMIEYLTLIRKSAEIVLDNNALEEEMSGNVQNVKEERT